MTQTPPDTANPPPPAPSAINFDRAEPLGPTAEHMQCDLCKRQITTEYWQLGRTLCGTCRSAILQAQANANRWETFLRAFATGSGMAVLCGVGYGIFVSIARMEFALITIGIGYVVGRLIDRATKGFATQRYQVLAVALTYFASTMGYAPFVVKGFMKNAENASVESRPSAPTATPENAGTSPSPRRGQRLHSHGRLRSDVEEGNLQSGARDDAGRRPRGRVQSCGALPGAQGGKHQRRPQPPDYLLRATHSLACLEGRHGASPRALPSRVVPEPVTAPVLTCRSCGGELADGLLACPQCRALLHRTQLMALAESASAHERDARPTEALRDWREALTLLPADTVQHRSVVENIRRLSQEVDQRAPRPPPRKDGRGAAAGLGAVGLLLWKFKFVALSLLAKGKLLLTGLTSLPTLLSMLGFFAVGRRGGYAISAGIVLSIYVHEMGHVWALRRLGIQATAPMFIPGLWSPSAPPPISRRREGRRARWASRARVGMRRCGAHLGRRGGHLGTCAPRRGLVGCDHQSVQPNPRVAARRRPWAACT